MWIKYIFLCPTHPPRAWSATVTPWTIVHHCAFSTPGNFAHFSFKTIPLTCSRRNRFRFFPLSIHSFLILVMLLSRRIGVFKPAIVRGSVDWRRWEWRNQKSSSYDRYLKLVYDQCEMTGAGWQRVPRTVWAKCRSHSQLGEAWGFIFRR